MNRWLSRCQSILRKIARKLCESVGCGSFSSVGLEHIDLQLVEILDRQRNGFFIEAGANDGLVQSNTYYLEKILGWRGLLIEPLPNKARECRKNRRKSEVINTALVSHDFSESTVTISPVNLMSVIRDGRIDAKWADEHAKLGRLAQNLREEPPIQVPASTLGKVLKARDIHRVNFFSLDVEGYELEVLLGIDFKDCQFDWIFVETRAENEKQINELLESHGYCVSRSWINESYSNKLYRNFVS